MKKILLVLGMILLLTSLVVAVEQIVSVNIIPGKLNIYSPNQNFIYEDRMVPINVSMDGNVSKFRYGYLDNGGKLVTLCRNCKEYGFSKLKLKPFDDGFHRLTLLAIFETGEVSGAVDFIVDTKDPKIKWTSPLFGKGNGEFKINFQEANPVELKLHIGEQIYGVDIEENCLSKDFLNYKCRFNVDLEEYDGSKIEYWFVLEDIVERTDESKKRSFRVVV